MTVAAADLLGDREVIARAEAVRPAVAAASDEIEQQRRLPPSVLDKLHEAELFRLLLPRSANGIETDPVTFFHGVGCQSLLRHQQHQWLRLPIYQPIWQPNQS